MPVRKFQWRVLADQFPPSLVTNASETSLQPNQTPNATGIEWENETLLSKQTTTPATTTRVVKSYAGVADGAGSTATYELHYERLWRISTAELIYGAPWQVGLYLPQGPGIIECNDDTGAILKIMPIGQTGLIAMKATGSYIIPNANSKQGRFEPTEFIQEAKISTATHCCELDGMVYFCNSDGLFSISIQGDVTELSLPVHDDVTAAVVTADYKNKLVKVAATTPFVYHVPTQRWFKYTGASTSTFTYETRRMQSLGKTDDEQPLTVDRIGFQVKWASGTADDEIVNLTYQTQVEDREWSDTQTVQVQNTRGSQDFVEHRPAESDTGLNFKLKLTDIPSEISIVRILVYTDAQVPEARES